MFVILLLFGQASFLCPVSPHKKHSSLFNGQTSFLCPVFPHKKHLGLFNGQDSLLCPNLLHVGHFIFGQQQALWPNSRQCTQRIRSGILGVFFVYCLIKYI